MRNAQLLVVLLTLFFINDSDALCGNYTTYYQECRSKYCPTLNCLLPPCPQPPCYNFFAILLCMFCRCSGGDYSDC
ncbi:UNVERIFIED_CONTAM: hypothetical protein RMT77_019232 [Armadillidium vulgare]